MSGQKVVLLLRKNAQIEERISVRTARRIIKGCLRREEKRKRYRAAVANTGMRAHNNARVQTEGRVCPDNGCEDQLAGDVNSGDSSAQYDGQRTAGMRDYEEKEAEDKSCVWVLDGCPSVQGRARGCIRHSLSILYEKLFNVKRNNYQNSNSNPEFSRHPKSSTFKSESGFENMDVGLKDKPGNPNSALLTKQRNGTFVGTLFEGLDRGAKLIRSTADKIASLVDRYLIRPPGPSCSKRRPPSSAGSTGSKKRSLLAGFSGRLTPDAKLFRLQRAPRINRFSVALSAVFHDTNCKSKVTHIHNLGLRSDIDGAESGMDAALTCRHKTDTVVSHFPSSSREPWFPVISDATITRPIPSPPSLGKLGMPRATCL